MIYAAGTIFDGRANCVLEISNARPRIRDLFKISKLSSVFEGGGESYFDGM